MHKVHRTFRPCSVICKGVFIIHCHSTPRRCIETGRVLRDKWSGNTGTCVDGTITYEGTTQLQRVATVLPATCTPGGWWQQRKCDGHCFPSRETCNMSMEFLPIPSIDIINSPLTPKHRDLLILAQFVFLYHFSSAYFFLSLPLWPRFTPYCIRFYSLPFMSCLYFSHSHCQFTSFSIPSYFSSLRARSCAVNWGTKLQAGNSLVPFPTSWMEFSVDLILDAALWSWELTACNRNQYHGSSWGGKDDRSLRLTFHRLCRKCGKLNISQCAGPTRLVIWIALLFP